MRIKPNPLVASFHGSAGAAVASTWHGINYIRKRVIPRNPKTDAQMAVRNSLARLVDLWQSWALTAYWPQIKPALTFAALPFNLPGYNTFVKRNRVLEQAGSELILIPYVGWTTPYGGTVGKVSAFAAATGASGAIDCTWTKLHASGYSLCFVWRKAGTDELLPTIGHAVAEESESLTISGLTAATEYQVYAYLHRNSDWRFGESVVDTATTGA